MSAIWYFHPSLSPSCIIDHLSLLCTKAVHCPGFASNWCFVRIYIASIKERKLPNLWLVSLQLLTFHLCVNIIYLLFISRDQCKNVTPVSNTSTPLEDFINHLMENYDTCESSAYMVYLMLILQQSFTVETLQSNRFRLHIHICCAVSR